MVVMTLHTEGSGVLLARSRGGRGKKTYGNLIGQSMLVNARQRCITSSLHNAAQHQRAIGLSYEICIVAQFA
jgi:hypothetical protein